MACPDTCHHDVHDARVIMTHTLLASRPGHTYIDVPIFACEQQQTCMHAHKEHTHERSSGPLPGLVELRAEDVDHFASNLHLFLAVRPATLRRGGRRRGFEMLASRAFAMHRGRRRGREHART